MRDPGNKLIATDSLSKFIAAMDKIKRKTQKPKNTINKEAILTRRRQNNATVGP
jgi:hypothetical protein